MDRRYGLVLGQGRSGTNWVVDSLDLSPYTFCRNEPDECNPSAMDELPNRWCIGADGAALAQDWDGVIDRTSSLMGERDHRLNHPKFFVNPRSQRLGVAQLSARPKARRLLSTALRSWRGGEWPMPGWVGSLDNPEIYTILKLVQGYNWATWVLDNRPNVPVVHVVRHPGGRHESFLRRYVAFADSQETRRQKIEQLRELTSITNLADRMGRLDDLTLAEAETWFGIYQMETIEQRAGKSDRYLRILYEEMVAQPAETTELIYEHFGLPITTDVRDRIEQHRDSSVFGGIKADRAEQINGWRARLDPEITQRIERALEASHISQWWDDLYLDEIAA